VLNSHWVTLLQINLRSNGLTEHSPRFALREKIRPHLAFCCLVGQSDIPDSTILSVWDSVTGVGNVLQTSTNYFITVFFVRSKTTGVVLLPCSQMYRIFSVTTGSVFQISGIHGSE
jgi:hypothetical protein